MFDYLLVRCFVSTDALSRSMGTLHTHRVHLSRDHATMAARQCCLRLCDAVTKGQMKQGLQGQAL